MNPHSSTKIPAVPKGRWSEIEANGYRYATASEWSRFCGSDESREQRSEHASALLRGRALGRDSAGQLGLEYASASPRGRILGRDTAAEEELERAPVSQQGCASGKGDSVDQQDSVSSRNEPEQQQPEPAQESATRLVPPPDRNQSETEKPGILSRAFSWLRGAAPAPKRLRLAETVALGEKRFVAIIYAEGHKYLVGGGASGVALLTRLDEPPKLIDSPEVLKDLVEVAG